jgi:hypothetical protein
MHKVAVPVVRSVAGAYAALAAVTADAILAERSPNR